MTNPQEKIQELEARIAELEAEKNQAYSERNKLVALASRMAIALNLNTGLGQHDLTDETWDNDWRSIVFIDLPSGQCSWHIHDSELPMFKHLVPYFGSWDGHTTEEKYERVLNAEF